MTITANELKVLRAILTNDFHDGNTGEDKINNPVWSNCINDAHEPSGIEGKALSGVVSSLCQKGLVKSDGEVVSLTRAGYDAAQ